MRRSLPIVVIILLFALMAMVIWVSNRLDFPVKPPPPPPMKSEIKPAQPAEPMATESLLAGYGDPSTPQSNDSGNCARRVPRHLHDLIPSPAGTAVKG